MQSQEIFCLSVIVKPPSVTFYLLHHIPCETMTWQFFPPESSPLHVSTTPLSNATTTPLFIPTKKRAVVECDLNVQLFYMPVFAGKCVRFPGYLNARLNRVITSNHLHTERGKERNEGEKVVWLKRKRQREKEP